jgi:hypothetical protein
MSFSRPIQWYHSHAAYINYVNYNCGFELSGIVEEGEINLR